MPENIENIIMIAIKHLEMKKYLYQIIQMEFKEVHFRGDCGVEW